jgi:hypothetical protein
LLFLVALVAVPATQSQLVAVTVPKANVRSEPSEKSPILMQATPQDQIEWRATEGDWFKVLMPPNPALGGARIEAYISKKVSKLMAAAAPPVSPRAVEPVSPPVPTLDTHAANVFLGSIIDGTLLKLMTVQIVHAGNRDAWTIQNPGDWAAAADRRPSLVVAIGDRAPFAPAGLAPSIVKLAPAADAMSFTIGSTKGGKDWKAEEISAEMTESAAGVWNIKPSRDLKPGSYAIIMRPSDSKAVSPEIAWAFTVK